MLTLLSALVMAATQPLPKAEPLPPPDFSDKQILDAIQTVLVTLEQGAGPALLTLVYPDGRVTARGTLASGFTGLRSSSWSEYAARMKPGAGFIERIANPVIEQDDDVAMVWTSFTIERDGKIVACGMDHFDLVREAGQWKLMNITFSSRVTGCPGQ